MIARALALMAVSLTVVTSIPGSGFAAAPSKDAQVVKSAARRLGHESPIRVVSWLRTRGRVETASLGPDRKTIAIRFRDGQRSFILPRSLRTVGMPAGARRFRALPMSRVASPAGGRALVLEPFETELNLPPNAGQIEASDLQSAGYQVDQLYDGQVTVNTMGTLSNYNVVYMHTHTGVAAGGVGLVATGQTAPCSSYESADGSVIVAGVAGSSQCYYGITSAYIRLHEEPFAPHSFLFINGCALLGTDFAQALIADGAGAMISWDADSATYDDFLSAAALFNQMDGGASIAAAISTLHANGSGYSSYQGVKATLGYAGDGSITLAEAAQGTPPPHNTPSPAPTASPAPSATVTPTLTPTAPPTAAPSAAPTTTATATPTVPANGAALSLRASVKPGQTQQIGVQGFDPSTSVSVLVSFPNGSSKRGAASADVAGEVSFSFVQPASVIMHRSSTAVVTVSGRVHGAAVSTQGQYRIGFGRIDVAVDAPTVTTGGTISVWAHTAVRTRVSVAVSGKSLKSRLLHAKTGKAGWAHVAFHVPKRVRHGTRITIRATAVSHRNHVRATTHVIVH